MTYPKHWTKEQCQEYRELLNSPHWLVGQGYFDSIDWVVNEMYEWREEVVRPWAIRMGLPDPGPLPRTPQD